jgi:hypothetical protein
MTTARSPHVATGHVGPISPDCPIDCLGMVLSAAAFNQLASCYGAPFNPPQTVGDVLELYRQGHLAAIAGLGTRRIGEIETSLIFAGLVISDHPRT